MPDVRRRMDSKIRHVVTESSGRKGQMAMLGEGGRGGRDDNDNENRSRQASDTIKMAYIVTKRREGRGVW